MSTNIWQDNIESVNATKEKTNKKSYMKDWITTVDSFVCMFKNVIMSLESYILWFKTSKMPSKNGKRSFI